MESIKEISARQIVVPLDSPVWLGGDAIRERQYCLVEITTETGLQGHGLGFTRAADLCYPIVHQLAPVLLKKDAGNIEGFWEAMYQRAHPSGRQGPFIRAISLVDIALWDLKAKQHGLPLHKILGGYRQSVPVMMAGGYYANAKGIGELRDEFQSYFAQGYRHMKLMIGGASPAEDLARWRAVRESLPDEVELGVDANGSWNDPKTAAEWIRRAGEAGHLAFVEEPLPPENFRALARLRDILRIPLAVGEFIASRWSFLEYLQGGCIDIIRADATLCGGISEWRKIAALANAWNVPLMPHYFASIHCHLAFALPGSKAIEVVSTTGNNSSFHQIAGVSYRLENGKAHPLGAQGLGLTLDQEFIRAHTRQKLSAGETLSTSDRNLVFSEKSI